MWHWSRRLKDDPDLTFDETWVQLREEWEKVSTLYERIRIRTQQEEQKAGKAKLSSDFPWNLPREANQTAAPETVILNQTPSTRKEETQEEPSEPQEEEQNSPMNEDEVRGLRTQGPVEAQEQQAECLSGQSLPEKSAFQVQGPSSTESEEQLQYATKERLEEQTLTEETQIEKQADTQVQEENQVAQNSEAQEEIPEEPEPAKEKLRQSQGSRQPIDFIASLGEQPISITLTTENSWKIEKKTNPLIAALFPMPERTSDMQISHFCAVQERYIQMWQRLMPRYTREQYRCTFEEYVQKYSWDVAVENSGWGTLEQHAAKYSNVGKKKSTSQPTNQCLKPQPKKTIETISPYRQQLIADRNALLEKLKMEKMGDVRRKLWYELIKIEEATGHELSKAVSKLYASWLRAARLKLDATLEVDEDEGSIIEWGGIRINLPQLKNWVIYQIGKLPREHRVALIRCCEQYLTFNELQAAELCRQLFQDSHSARSFMKMFRKTLITGVMGWKPLIMALRAAVNRWSDTEMKRLLKEFFDPNEYAYLWARLSKFSDTKEQLETRLQIQEEGIRLPQGNQKKYIKWLQNTNEATEHAKMMILLQRTQELDIHEWREIREQAYVRFGKEEYKKLLQERDEMIPEVPRGSIPTFDGKRVMFGAMKEEQSEITPEWSQYLPEVHEGLKNGQKCSELLQKLLNASGEEAKMKKSGRTCKRRKLIG
jgi:hypothetical protein